MILESTYELSCAHVPQAAPGSAGFITIRNGTETVENPNKTLLFVKFYTMTVVIFVVCLSFMPLT